MMRGIIIIMSICFVVLGGRVDDGRLGKVSRNYIVFDGSTGYVTVPDNAALDFGTGDFSISFWINVDYTTGSQEIIDKYDSVSQIGYEMDIDSGQIRILLGDGVSYPEASAAVPALNEWFFVTATVDRDGNIILYINGVAEDTLACTAGLTIDNLVDCFLGVYNDEDIVEKSAYLQGSMDDLRIYKAVLTEDEITTIYAGGRGKKYKESDTPTSGAVSAAWNIDEKKGTAIIDEIVPLTGTFSGGVIWEKQHQSKRERL